MPGRQPVVGVLRLRPVRWRAVSGRARLGDRHRLDDVVLEEGLPRGAVQQWQVQVSSRGRSLSLTHLPATAPPAKPMILAPRTPRSRPSSSALVVDSASASAHTTRLAARDTTGARSAGRVHAGPESAASWLTASVSMLESSAVHAMRPPITSSNYGGNNQVTYTNCLQVNIKMWLLTVQTIICTMYTHAQPNSPGPSVVLCTTTWAHSSVRLHPQLHASKWAVRRPRTVGGSECAHAHLSMCVWRVRASATLPTVPL